MSGGISGQGIVDVTFDPTGRFIYFADEGNTAIGFGRQGSVDAYTIDPSTGALTGIDGYTGVAGNFPLQSKEAILSVAADPTGRFLYAGSSYGSVHGFAIDQTGGSLTPVPGDPFPGASGPIAVTKFGSVPLLSNSSTPVSSQVAAQSGELTVTLPNISGSTNGGTATVSVMPVSPSALDSFSLSNNLDAYTISTTALFAASPANPVTICVQVLNVTDQTTFNSLQFLHVVNGLPQNITTSVNFSTKTICGATTSFSPFIVVKGPLQQLADLINQVSAYDLTHGAQTSLDAKLQNASAALTSARNNDTTVACNSMSAFISEAAAQSGNGVSPSEAHKLGSSAKEIKLLLGCTN